MRNSFAALQCKGSFDSRVVSHLTIVPALRLRPQAKAQALSNPYERAALHDISSSSWGEAPYTSIIQKFKRTKSQIPEMLTLISIYYGRHAYKKDRRECICIYIRRTSPTLKLYFCDHETKFLPSFHSSSSPTV
jgi:hypothetical protein